MSATDWTEGDYQGDGPLGGIYWSPIYQNYWYGGRYWNQFPDLSAPGNNNTDNGNLTPIYPDQTSNGGGGNTDHVGQLREINGIQYVWDPDTQTLTPLANQPPAAPAFDNYGGAQYIGIDGPRGAVYRASNGDYVYGDQVFRSWTELNSVLSTSQPDAATQTIREGPDGQQYMLVNGSWQLIPGMPGAVGSTHTSIQNIGGMATLIDTQTGEVIKVIGPAGSPSSSGGGGGSSPGGLISGRTAAVNTGTGALVSSSSGYDQMAAQAAQRQWQEGQNALDRAQQAAQFAQTFGLQAAQFELTKRDRADQAAKTYAELVSATDTAALPAYLAAGGGSIFNALATNNSMLTDNAIRPGAMALDNARWYQGQLNGTSGGNTGGGGMPADPFSSPSIYDPPTPLVQNPDGTVSHGGGETPAGGGDVVMGRERRGGGGLGGGALGYRQTGFKSGGTPYFDPAPRSYGTSPFWSEADAQTAFNGYAEAQAMQDAQRAGPQSYAQAFPTLYQGATYWQNGQLMYNTPSGPIPASMIDPYTLSSGVQGNSPYASNALLPQNVQDAVAADPRSINPNLNLPLQAQNTNYMRPTPVASTPLRGYTGTLPNGQRVVNGVPAGPASVAPNVARFARGGMINGLGIVGDSPSGRRTGHEELVFAPRGAMVFPLNKIGHHAKGGAIDPFAPAGSSEPTADPLSSSKSGGYTSQVETPTPVPDAPTPTPEPTTAGTNTPLANVDIPNSPIASAVTPTTAGGMTIINGPDNTPPGTPLPSPMTAEEVRRWRENFPIPVISGPWGPLNPMDVAWQNVDPTARDVFYNANQTRFGIPAASQSWESDRFRLPGAPRGGWGY